jgi:homoaconitate hydratase
VKPEFCDLVKGGANIVVAGTAFGCGSSRETAPWCLLGAGVKAVIARDFAFIYARNQVNNGLLGICMDDDRFYKLATEGAVLSIDVERRTISCDNETFPFTLDPIEEQLLAGGGLVKVYEQFGPGLFQRLQNLSAQSKVRVGNSVGGKLEW